ncbi:Hypothetical protein A7982_09140 [Minicystis rosea]|nr:Hypothetical protein A7982_09140 [Minicystis rosea]
MFQKLCAAATIAFACVLALPACNTKPPKQAESFDPIADKGADMPSTAGNGPIQPVIVDPAVKCCGQCKAALAKDRTGAKPETIPCTDFTADLDVSCLEYFRGKKTMAAECK